MSENEITWKELADFIESEEIGFDMDHWNDITSCGTVACIGGSYEFLYEKKFGESVSGLQLNIFQGMNMTFCVSLLLRTELMATGFILPRSMTMTILHVNML